MQTASNSYPFTKNGVESISCKGRSLQLIDHIEFEQCVDGVKEFIGSSDANCPINSPLFVTDTDLHPLHAQVFQLSDLCVYRLQDILIEQAHGSVRDQSSQVHSSSPKIPIFYVGTMPIKSSLENYARKYIRKALCSAEESQQLVSAAES